MQAFSSIHAFSFTIRKVLEVRPLEGTLDSSCASFKSPSLRRALNWEPFISPSSSEYVPTLMDDGD